MEKVSHTRHFFHYIAHLVGVQRKSFLHKTLFSLYCLLSGCIRKKLTTQERKRLQMSCKTKKYLLYPQSILQMGSVIKKIPIQPTIRFVVDIIEIFSPLYPHFPHITSTKLHIAPKEHKRLWQLPQPYYFLCVLFQNFLDVF